MISLQNITGDVEPGAIAHLQSIVSPSRLSLFHQCRLKFFFRYVEEVEKPKSPALHLGGAVHSALKVWNKARWRDQPRSLEELKGDYLLAWSMEAEAVQWDKNENELQGIGWKLVETYLTHPERKERRPEAVEVPVEADLARHGLPTLVGVIDLVERGVIIDYKSSASTPTPAKVAHLNEVQTSGYAILYREATGRSELGLEIHTLVKLKAPKNVISELPPLTEAQQTRLFRQMESYVRGLEARDWVPSPGLQCSCCEYFNECRNWS
jgi:putative RecB family exonuclease